MLHEFCGFRRLGIAAAVGVSVIGSLVLVYGLITPRSVQLLRTPELVAVLALFVLPALALAAMRRAASSRAAADQQPPASARRSQHEPAPTDAGRAERHRRRSHAASKA